MGGPSAAIVIEELIDLGARTLVRIGTCGALVEGLELGELVSAREVIAADGASSALGASARLAPDPDLERALGARAATAVSTDLFYDAREEVEAEWVEAGAEVVEMEAATLLAIAGAARRRGRRPAGGERPARGRLAAEDRRGGARGGRRAPRRGGATAAIAR